MPTQSGLPSFESYFVPTVDCVKARGESTTVSEMENDVAAVWQLSDVCLSVPASDGRNTQFQSELARVRAYLKKAGVLDDSVRGVWRLTSRGVHMTNAAIRAVPRTVRRLEKQASREQQARKAPRAEPAGFAEAQQQSFGQDWREYLLNFLRSMTPQAFERFVQLVLRASGFSCVDIRARSGDGGVDGTGLLRIGLLSFHVLFQCKRDSGCVGAGVVRDFREVMAGQADKGLIMTTGTFDLEAQREAMREDAPAVSLIDGTALCEILKQYRIGVTVRQNEESETIEVDMASMLED